MSYTNCLQWSSKDTLIIPISTSQSIATFKPQASTSCGGRCPWNHEVFALINYPSPPLKYISTPKHLWFSKIVVSTLRLTCGGSLGNHEVFARINSPSPPLKYISTPKHEGVSKIVVSMLHLICSRVLWSLSSLWFLENSRFTSIPSSLTWCFLKW